MVIPIQKKDIDNVPAVKFRASGALARWPLIGLLMVLLGGIGFSICAVNLQTNGPLTLIDVQVANATHVVAMQSSSLMKNVMIFGFYLGEQIIMAIGVVLVLFFLFKRYWPELCMVAVAWLGEGAIWIVLSGYFNRARPVFDAPVWHQMTAPGFPSGHSIAAVMCFSLIAYFLAPMMRSRLGKAVIYALALFVILYIGFSRIFIGDHYLTDVLAGYSLGVAWSGFVYTSVELIFKKRIKGYVQEK